MAHHTLSKSTTTKSPILRLATVLAVGIISATVGYLALTLVLDGLTEKIGLTLLVTISVGLLAMLGMGTVHAFYVGHKKATEEIDYIHRLDSTTGLLSRPGLEHEINLFMAEDSDKGGLVKAYLIAFEFDSIKDINEMYGHEIGDAIIKVLAQRLLKIVGDLGPVGRVSGSEYVVVFTAGTNERELKVAVDTLIEAMSQPIKVGSTSMAVFGNAGVVRLHQRTTKLETALRCATLARASARAAGRGTWSIYHPEMSQIAAYRKWLESELSSALQRNEFALHYQPQVESSTGTIVGYEALLRWTHHDKGAIPPSEFIEIAEQCGLIRPIGAWVLRQACSDAMQLPDHMTMSVNVSSVQIMDADFIKSLHHILQTTGLPPQRLELEVTESVVISDFKTVRDRFAQVHDMGCAIAIDDFGTGYSNLTNLSELPFNKLKIDKSFVDRLINQKKMGSIVSTIVNLASSMGATAIAEGVEAADQAELLSKSGCTLIQGYYYSKPLTLTQAKKLGSTIPRSSHEPNAMSAETFSPRPATTPNPMPVTQPKTAYTNLDPVVPPLAIAESSDRPARHPAVTTTPNQMISLQAPSNFEQRFAKIATS